MVGVYYEPIIHAKNQSELTDGLPIYSQQLKTSYGGRYTTCLDISE